MNAIDVYEGSNADFTRSYYTELQKRGPIGVVAMNLFRASKASDRAKKYRGGLPGQGSFRRMAYEKKAWSMNELCGALTANNNSLNIKFGWKQDPDVLFDERPAWVLYVELPNGQVSFHNPSRGHGPDYAGVWSGLHNSPKLILEFCDSVFGLQTQGRLL